MNLLPTYEKINPVLLFAGVHLRHWFSQPFAKFHTRLFDHYLYGGDRIMAVIPRGFSKSTCYAHIAPLYEIFARNKYKKLMLWSMSSALVESHLRIIRRELMHNTSLHATYGKPSIEVDRQNEILLWRPDGTPFHMMALGAGSQTVGWRPDMVIVDDIEDPDKIRSEIERERTRSWFFEELMPTIDQGGKAVLIGTTFHPLALISEMLRDDGPGQYWNKLYVPCYDELGASIWPERFSVDDLERKRLEFGAKSFAANFLLKPIIDESPVFDHRWFEMYEATDPRYIRHRDMGLYTMIAIDPAVSKKTQADYSAITVAQSAYDDKVSVYIPHCERGHWGATETLNRAINLAEAYKDRSAFVEIGIETAAQQAIFLPLFERVQQERGVYFNVRGLEAVKDKVTRAFSVQKYVQNGQIKFLQNNAGVTSLIDEMAIFPTGRNDDMTDSFVYAAGECLKQSRYNQANKESSIYVLPYEPMSFTGTV